MPTWDELDAFTAPRRLLALALGLAAIVAIRASLDATSPDLLGWTSWFVQFALAIALLGLCIARVVFLTHRRLRARPVGEPLITERFAIIALISLVVVVRVIRGRGTGDLDTVALGVQLAAVGLLVAIGFRRVILMAFGRIDFSMWPWLWLALFLSSTMAATGQGDSTAFKAAFGVLLFLALSLLALAIYGAVRRRRRRPG